MQQKIENNVEETNVDVDLSGLMSQKQVEALENAIERPRHPIWKPTRTGAAIIGTLIDAIGFPQLADGKGSILLNIQTASDQYPILSLWVNTVLTSKLYKLAGITTDPKKDNFDTKLAVIDSLVGKDLAIQFLGNVSTGKAGRKPYANYKIVMIEPEQPAQDEPVEA